jgi:hypothetical protein
MKNYTSLLVAICFLMLLNSCKKSDTKPAPVKTTTTTPQSAFSLLAGKWLVTGDSVQTYSSGVLVPNLVQRRVFDANDFITFNKDSTAVISNNATLSAFYTDYRSSNATGVLSVNNDFIANLRFKYSVSMEGYSINSSASQTAPQPVYGLTANNIVAGLNMGYGITTLSATSLVLERELELPTIQHNFKVKEIVYLSK